MFEKYETFLKDLDLKLQKYFEVDKDKIQCRKGCSNCCKNADFPLSLVEMKYLMQGFLKLDKSEHDKVRENIKKVIESGKENYDCPFLMNDLCSVYEYRPIICRVHGLAYLRTDGIVNLPECSISGLNYSKNYDGKTVNFEPINEDLNPIALRKNKKIDFGEVRSMIKWFGN
ncbi:YkgJ family cysteine cluster protein [bacterium]|nr:YkgJ family cysteine cluster protein [bacterium]